MAMPNDFYEYMRPVRTSAQEAVYLTERLVNAAPEDLASKVAAALDAACMRSGEALEIMKQRRRAKPVTAVPTERVFEGLWGALHQQIDAWVRIPGEPLAKIAERILASYFPAGLTFLTLKFEDEWVESRARLERIDEEGVEAALAQLIHPSLLPKLRAIHVELGDVLGVGETPVEIPSGRALYEAIRAASLAIANYVRLLAGTIDEDDPESVAMFVKAVAPIAEHRAQYSTNRTTTEPTEPTDVIDPEAPIPPVEPEADVVEPVTPSDPTSDVE